MSSTRVSMPDGLDKVNLAFDSKDWDEGFRFLNHLVDDLRNASESTLDETGPRGKRIVADCQHVDRILARVLALVADTGFDPQLVVASQDPIRARLAVAMIDSHLGHIKTTEEGFARLRAQRHALVRYHNAMVGLHRQYLLLRKIADALIGIHDEYGASYRRHPVAVMKLVVCMKCLDAVWAKMRDVALAADAAGRAWEADHKDYEFPFEELDIFTDDVDDAAGPAEEEEEEGEEEQDEEDEEDLPPRPKMGWGITRDFGLGERAPKI